MPSPSRLNPRLLLLLSIFYGEEIPYDQAEHVGREKPRLKVRGFSVHECVTDDRKERQLCAVYF